MPQSCRTCRFLDVKPDNAGRRMPRKHNVYACLCPLPPLPDLPASLTDTHWFKPLTHEEKRFMQPDDGSSCPTYKLLAKAAA